MSLVFLEAEIKNRNTWQGTPAFFTLGLDICVASSGTGRVGGERQSSLNTLCEARVGQVARLSLLPMGWGATSLSRVKIKDPGK